MATFKLVTEKAWLFIIAFLIIASSAKQLYDIHKSRKIIERNMEMIEEISSEREIEKKERHIESLRRNSIYH